MIPLMFLFMNYDCWPQVQTNKKSLDKDGDVSKDKLIAVELFTCLLSWLYILNSANDFINID